MIFYGLRISSIIEILPNFSYQFVIFSTDSRSELEKLFWFRCQISSSSPRLWKILGSQCSHLLTIFQGMSLQICPCQVVSYYSPLRWTYVDSKKSLDLSSKALFLWDLTFRNDLSTFREMPFYFVKSMLASFPLMQSMLRSEILRDLGLCCLLCL